MTDVPAPRKRGALIVFEGIDGAGKTTQVGLLVDALRRAGVEVVSSKEPTRGPWGMKIRESAVSGRLPAEEELQAFIEDRREHVRDLVGPALARGAVVVLDRYFYSTIAYQGAWGADVAALRARMNEFPRPDVVFVLDVDEKVGLGRVADRDGVPNLFENVDQLSRARRLFLKMNGDITVHVDASASIEQVQAAVFAALAARLDALEKALCAKSYGCDDKIQCGYRLGGDCDWWNLRRALHRK